MYGEHYYALHIDEGTEEKKVNNVPKDTRLIKTRAVFKLRSVWCQNLVLLHHRASYVALEGREGETCSHGHILNIVIIQSLSNSEIINILQRLQICISMYIYYILIALYIYLHVHKVTYM